MYKRVVYAFMCLNTRFHLYWLDQGKQNYILNNYKSNIETIRCRVPQGSNLGPTLFFLYINDLSKWLETTCPNLYFLMSQFCNARGIH